MAARTTCSQFVAITSLSAILAGCLSSAPAYRAEYKKMESEAAVKFPPGSHAPAFEAWFAEHGAVREPMSPGEVEGACQPRRMQLKRVEGCVNLMTANYCVSASDKIERLTFSDGGYC
jgi:hypothetical protein